MSAQEDGSARLGVFARYRTCKKRIIYSMICYLRDGAEAKDLRVADARHVGQHVRNVFERVRHKVIETREAGGRALVVVLQLAEVGGVVLPARRWRTA